MTPRVALIALFVWSGGVVAARADVPCKLTPIGVATVSLVRDGRTVALSDGRELLLAAIEVTELSRPALEAAIAGRPLRLAKLGEELDRYGRIVAFAFPGETQTSLQETLLAQGHARVAARVGDKACADHLRAIERDARRAGLGQWPNPNFAPLPAENFRRLDAERGHFVLVEGKVLSVRESGATTYVNFGRRWTQALTVTILRREVGRFAAAGLDPKQLEGRRLLVRGILEQRTGPTIEAAAPEQIELVD
jgi:endonuclease YncB( thermonuclease family)